MASASIVARRPPPLTTRECTRYRVLGRSFAPLAWFLIFTFGAVVRLRTGAEERLVAPALDDPGNLLWIVMLGAIAAVYGAIGLRWVCRFAGLRTACWLVPTLAYGGALFALAYVMLSI